MRTYQIMIDENQRDMIAAALTAYAPACFESDDRDELDMLTDMFDALEHVPDNETGHKMLHGFCL